MEGRRTDADVSAEPAHSLTATPHALQTFRPDPKRARQGVALCLSGGGFRAALFHLGALRRLNELGILAQLTTISSVSGGSILSAHLAQQIRAWPQSPGAVGDWQRTVSEPFYRFVQKNLRTGPLLKRLLPWNWLRGSTAVEALATSYQRRLTSLTLPALPKRPRFVFCSTDLAFGVNWIFDSAGPGGQSRLGQYQAGYLSPLPDWPLARAVAASSCFPPVFDPLSPNIPPTKLLGGDYLKADRDQLVRSIRLSDGGVYDNLGLEPVWKDHRVVLCSDGGAVFRPKRLFGLFWRADRYTSVVERQARGVRTRWLISSFLNSEIEGSFWGIGSSVSHYERSMSAGVATYVGYSEPLVDDVISAIRTDLDVFSDAEIAVLENHGYLLANAAAKSHLADLIQIEAPLTIPHPDWMEESRVRTALRNSGKRKLLGRNS